MPQDSIVSPGVASTLPRLGLVRQAAVLLALSAAPAAAQQFTVQGRVLDAAGRTPLAGISVTLAGRPTSVTTEDGRFRFRDVPAGRYLLTANGLGYAVADTTLLVVDNMTVELLLDVAPVRLDSLEVRVRETTVRGVVRDKSSGVALMGVDVTASPDRRVTTDGIGRFKFGKLPSGTPFDLSVRMFCLLAS